MAGESFPEFFVEQGFVSGVVFFLVTGAIYLAVLMGTLVVVRGRLQPRRASSVMLAGAVTLLLAALGITLFEAAALWYRTMPHGYGLQRQGQSLERFHMWIEVAFIGFYAFLVTMGAGVGWLIGRVRVGKGVAVSIAAGIAVVAYLALTLPVVEYMNACNVGRPLLANAYVRCG